MLFRSTSAATNGAIDAANYSHITVQISGNLDTAKCTIQGTNAIASTPSTWSATASNVTLLDTSTGFIPWYPLSDLVGNALSALGSGEIERTSELPRFIRPYVSGVTGGNEVNVYIVQYGDP